jgi:hypothetical protein
VILLNCITEFKPYTLIYFHSFTLPSSPAYHKLVTAVYIKFIIIVLLNNYCIINDAVSTAELTDHRMNGKMFMSGDYIRI